MGWNKVKQVNNHPLWSKIEDNSRFIVFIVIMLRKITKVV